jgi:hypothetical protein
MTSLKEKNGDWLSLVKLLLYVKIVKRKRRSSMMMQPYIAPAIRSDNLKKNTSTTSSSTSATATCHARGLTVAYSRKLSTILGGSTSTRPEVRKITLKTCDFIGISNAVIPTTLGGSTTTSPPIMDTILRQQLDYVIIDYGRADRGARDKS